MNAFKLHHDLMRPVHLRSFKAKAPIDDGSLRTYALAMLLLTFLFYRTKGLQKLQGGRVNGVISCGFYMFFWLSMILLGVLGGFLCV